MSVEVKVEGAKELVVKLEKMADAAKITSGLTKGALLVERAARENCPKGTGELRRSITSKVEDTTAIIYTPLEYAPYVEYGTGLFAEVSGRVDVPWNYQDDLGNWHRTSGQHPHPYMRPALDNNRKEVTRTIKEAIFND